MISAAKFFQEESQEEESKEVSAGSFSKWQQQSPCAWCVEPSSESAQNWILELESYLNKDSCPALLLSNREGLTVSGPLQLSPKTLTKSNVTPTPEGAFCIAGLVPGGPQCQPLEFWQFQDHNNKQQQQSKYLPEVPPGYEEVETLAKLTQEKKEPGDKSPASPNSFYLLEIQHRGNMDTTAISKPNQKNVPKPKPPKTETEATLETIGLIWNRNDNNDNQKEYPQNKNNGTTTNGTTTNGTTTNGNQLNYLSAAQGNATTNGITTNGNNTNGNQLNYLSAAQENNTWDNIMSAEGIKVKLISSWTLRQIVGRQPIESNDAEDLSWILDELETVPSLTLPQPVGENFTGSSLVLVVSLDPVAAGQHNHTHNNHGQEDKFTLPGHLVLGFQRTSSINTPLCQQLFKANFAIGRSVQVVHHGSSEQETIQLALKAALSNAERFVPEYQRKQWENVPDALVMVLPHPALADSPMASWLRSPGVRRSDFDPAFGNVLLRLTYGDRYSPPLTYYVDSHKNVPQVTWNDIWKAHQMIQETIERVRVNAVYYNDLHRKVLKPDASIVNGQDIYKLCVNMEAGKFDSSKNPGFRNTYCDQIQKGYLSRMLTALMIERFRCFEDMKKHDLYSIHWKDHTVEIPPPLQPVGTCPACSHQYASSHTPLCAYHLAQVHFSQEAGRSPIPGIPIPIRTKRQLEQLPMVFWIMRPEDSLVVKITVPGVAEDFPLVSIGDMVRLFFRTSGVEKAATEVIAEVVDVVVKTEVVTIRLPAPPKAMPGAAPFVTPGCLPYLQALLHTRDFHLNPRDVINPAEPKVAQAILGDQGVMDQFRFDIRFGYQGGRGFDIIQEVLGEFFAPPQLQVPPPPNWMTKKERKHHIKQNEKRLSFVKEQAMIRIHRLIAPTKRLLPKDTMVLASEREDRLRKQTNLHPPLNFVLPVNDEQQRVVEDITYGLHGLAPYIIEGPAGTGKSMCVCEAIIQVLKLPSGRPPKILVCAPSDAACDVLATRLLPLLPRSSLLRINWWSRKVGSVKPALLSSCPLDAGGTFSLPSLAELKAVDVVVCQCFVAECLEVAGTRGWTKAHFTHLFIDETSQAMECEALVPMAKVGVSCSIVLAGDPKQLGPTVRDPVAAKMGLGVSIQERLLNLPLYKYQHHCIMTRLVKNYRSNEALLTVPSNLFYEGSLEAMAPAEVADPFADLGDLGEAGFPLLLCNVHDGSERSKLDTPSFYNLEECNAVVSLVQGLLRCKSKEGVPPLHTGQICVITPFRAQVLALRTILRASNLGGINVGVVEDFQGQETKVVLISTVLTQDHQRWNNKDERLGFLHDPKRFNVAITRAHALCVIVGHAEYLEKSGTYWAALMDHIRRNDGVLGEEMDEEDDLVENADDLYGISELLRRVDELQLLGAGAEQDRHDLSYFYTDVPQWKVMLS